MGQNFFKIVAVGFNRDGLMVACQFGRHRRGGGSSDQPGRKLGQQPGIAGKAEIGAGMLAGSGSKARATACGPRLAGLLVDITMGLGRERRAPPVSKYITLPPAVPRAQRSAPSDQPLREIAVQLSAVQVCRHHGLVAALPLRTCEGIRKTLNG